MVTLAVLSSVSPSPLALDLERWGYVVYEAIKFSEILYLCDNIKPTAVVVCSGAEVHGISDIAQHQIVIEQHEGCTTEQLVETLTMMFGHNAPDQ